MMDIWPPDYNAEFQNRHNRLRVIVGTPGLLRELKDHYTRNPQDFINDWCVTYNPRNKTPLPKTMPFLMFRRQLEFIDFLQGCLQDGQGGLVEKARDIGATWLCCAYSVWLWLFMPGSAVGWGSRKEDLVDTLGDPDSIFEKMRMIIDNIPQPLLPVGFIKSKHATYMKMLNPETGSTITGEAGDNIGRGGRKTIYFKDESAHYERPELIEAALGDNTDCQIDISSVNGTNNVFYNRRLSGIDWTAATDWSKYKGYTRVFIFDWKHHPGKTQKWYDERRAKAEREGLLHLFAQEVDRDYAASIEGVIIPAKWVKAAIDAHIKLKFIPIGEKVAGQDVADEGGDKHALAWRHGVILQDAQHWGDGDGGDCARKAMDTCALNGIREIYYDSIGVGAAFKSETNRLESLDQLPKGLKIYPWNAGLTGERIMDAEENLIIGDPFTPINKDFFLNLKVQAWWRLRARFEKTYKAVTQGAKYPFDELISLPSTLENIHIIERELSQAVYKKNEAGKIKVDKKPDGAHSPNIADAIVICYNPLRELSILDVVY